MIWTFEHIDGRPHLRMKLTLEGWNAPFGRPRKGAIMKETIRSRIHTTHYPGSDQQTRHAFGTNWEPIELRGRWMTKANFDKSAREIADSWTEFVRTEATCRIAWGNIESWQGYVEELSLERESEHEIAWTMKIQIDKREGIGSRKKGMIVVQPIENRLKVLNDWMDRSKILRQKLDTSLTPDFAFTLDSLINLVNTPSAQLNRFAGRFDDFVKSSEASVQAFFGAVSGLRTGLEKLRETVNSIPIEKACIVRTAQSDLAWVQYQADLDNEAYEILAMLADLERDALAAQSSIVTSSPKLVKAREGDTWESLSKRITGGLDAANTIRSLAGAKYGEKPTPGEQYIYF